MYYRRKEYPPNPNLVYVEAEVRFSDEGFLEPLSFVFEGKRYVISQVLDSSYVVDEDYERLFPSGQPFHPVFRFQVKVGRAEANLYFDRMVTLKSTGYGRWFVEKKSPGASE